MQSWGERSVGLSLSATQYKKYVMKILLLLIITYSNSRSVPQHLPRWAEVSEWSEINIIFTLLVVFRASSNLDSVSAFRIRIHLLFSTRIRIQLKKIVTNYMMKSFLELKKTKRIAQNLKTMDQIQIYLQLRPISLHFFSFFPQIANSNIAQLNGKTLKYKSANLHVRY